MKAKRFRLTYLIIALVVVGALGTAGLFYLKHRQTKPIETAQFAPLPEFPHHNPATRAEEYQAADNYLISRVGADNFHKYFQRWPERASWASPSDSDFDFLSYHSSLFKKYSGNHDGQSVQVNRKNLQEMYGSVPPCALDATQCNPALSEDDVKQVARQHGLTGDLFVLLREVPHSKVHRYAFDVESCNEKKALYIDYNDGHIVATDRGCIPVEL